MDQSGVCRFFMKGHCRFGNNCRYAHPQTTTTFGQGNVFARTQQQNYSGGGQQQQHFGGYSQQAQQHRHKIDENLLAIEELLKKDMIEWEKGGIWPLSVYSPLTGKPSLPGFEDLSYEELRFATLQNNRQPPQEFQNKLTTWNTNRLNYMRSSAETRALLEAISLGKTIPSQQQQLQQQQGMSPFGSSQPQTSSIFGGGGFASQASTGSSPFGSSLSVSKPFGQAGFTSSSTPAQQQPFGSFGTARTETMEMNNAAGGAGSALSSFSFGQAMSQTQPGFNQGGFSNQGPNLLQAQTQQQPQQQQQQNVFASQFSFQSNLNQTPQQQQQPQQQFASNATPSAGMFGQQQAGFPQMSPFGQPPQQQQFQQQQPLMNTNINAFVTNVSSFGGGGGGGGDSMQDDLTLYSKETDLSASELQAFEAHTFDIDTLPLNAPPKRLCS